MVHLGRKLFLNFLNGLSAFLVFMKSRTREVPLGVTPLDRGDSQDRPLGIQAVHTPPGSLGKANPWDPSVLGRPAQGPAQILWTQGECCSGVFSKMC